MNPEKPLPDNADVPLHPKMDSEDDFTLGHLRKRLKPFVPLMIGVSIAGFFVEYSVREIWNRTRSCEPVSKAATVRTNENFSRYGEAKQAAMDVEVPPNIASLYRKRYAAVHAERYGLTLVDTQEHQQQIDRAGSVDDILEAVNDYTEERGFTVGIADLPLIIDRDDAGTEYLSDFDKSQIELDQFRHGASILLDSLYYLPQEVTSLTGLREISIVKRLPGVSGGDAKVKEGKIRFSLDTFYNLYPQTLAHEEAHLADAAICGNPGFAQDDLFQEHNPPGLEYSGKPGNVNLGGAGAKENKLPRGVLTEYGATGATEDKAEIYESLLTGFQRSVLENEDPIVRAKAELLISRLEEYVPGLSAYLVAINNPTFTVRREEPAEENVLPNKTPLKPPSKG